MFRPPICFGTRGIDNPTKELEFVARECEDQEVPMRVLRLDGWPVGTSEDPPLAQATLPGNNVSLFWTIKATLPRSTFTLKEGTIDSPYTAANFSEETTNGGNIVALFLYGLDVEDMKEHVPPPYLL